MNEFLFCYKPLEINQSLGFYQFTARGTNYRLIKSLASSNRNWKKEFFFVSDFWVGNLVDVGRDTFTPYTGDLRNLRLEGMPFPFSLLFLPFYLYLCLTFTYCFAALRRASSTVITSIGLICSLLGISIPWSPFNAWPSEDSALNHLLKLLHAKLQFKDVSFYLHKYYMLYFLV